jgi:hypothetical protein
MLKMDLNDDLVFVAEILLEEKDALIYKQDIPGTDVKTQNHFLYVAEIGSDTYEVRDIFEEEYGAGMIEKMLQAAKTIKQAVSQEKQLDS